MARSTRPLRWPALAGAALVLGLSLAALGRLAPAAAREVPGETALPGPQGDIVPPEAPVAPEPIPERVGPRVPAQLSAQKGDGFISYVRPDDVLVYSEARKRAGPGASPAEVEAAAAAFLAEWGQDHYHGPAPEALEEIYARERAILAGDDAGAASGSGRKAGDGSGANAASDAADAPEQVEGLLRLFTVAVEFDGTDTVENFSHEVGIRTGVCVTETVTYQGPLHNEIAHPGPRDNNTFWMPTFEKDFFEKLILSEEGVTERARMDLIDPRDGQPGIDIRGQTMANYFREVSAGKIHFDTGAAGIQAWVKVPHSVGYYGANACRGGNVSGGGLTTNPTFPNGMRQFIVDTAAAINAADPDFPWADYDTDGNGVIDHVVFIHAGIDESEGGGVQGNQQIWAHRSSYGMGGYVVDDRGTPDTADDIRLNGYTIQPENLNLGVLVHEFGHDLGLPDLYTNTGDEDVVWWDLMSTGSHPGRLKGKDPTHMGPWDKLTLGWLEPELIVPIDDPETRVFGQASQPPEGSTRAVRIDIPPTINRLIKLPVGSTQAWWAGDTQTWADHRLLRDLDLSGVTGPVSFTFQLDWVLERDWDFAFVEVSVDGGQTYTQTKGLELGSGRELTTPEGYGDPNGMLARFGRLRYGYTGDSQDWRAVVHDLSPYAGQAIKLRLRYATDAGQQERGVFADNFRVLAGDRVLLEDPAEGDFANGWTVQAGTFQGQLRDQGWRMSDGTTQYPRYYLLEWRNPVGFDYGLLHTYNTIFANLTPAGEREFMVDKVASNVPGLLVWLRDTRFGAGSPNNNILGTPNMTSAQSEGAKGGLQIIDAHPEPLRGPLGGKFTNAFGSFPYPPEDSWRGRVQTTNSAFGLRDTAPLTLTVATGADLPATTVMTATGYGPLPPVTGFHDAIGHSPGIEALPLPILVESSDTIQRIKRYAFKDPDASTVVPAADYYPPRTPPGFTGLGGETSPPSADISSAETMFLRGTTPVFVDVGAPAGWNVTGEHSGNPGDYGVQLGYHFRVIEEAPDGSTGTVQLWRQADGAEAAGMIQGHADGRSGMLSARLRNTGGAITLTLYSDFNERDLRYTAGSATEGAVPVGVPPEEVVYLVARRGPEALRSLAVAPENAVALAWAGRVPSGATVGFDYGVQAETMGPWVDMRNEAYAYGTPARLLDRSRTSGRIGGKVWMPVLRLRE